jgi:hypothetical protein
MSLNSVATHLSEYGFSSSISLSADRCGEVSVETSMETSYGVVGAPYSVSPRSTSALNNTASHTSMKDVTHVGNIAFCSHRASGTCIGEDIKGKTHCGQTVIGLSFHGGSEGGRAGAVKCTRESTPTNLSKAGLDEWWL